MLRGNMSRALVLLLAAICVLPTRAVAARGPRRTVVVALVVDQLAAWIAAERVPKLPRSGGFARLRREGTWVRALTYEHAVTDTAPGHATLFTGAPPRDTGIVANERTDGARPGVRVAFLRDDSVRLVAADGRLEAPGTSLAALRVPTVADGLRAAAPEAVILGLSIKDRGAVFAAGRQPTAAVWFEVALGQFVTSTAFAEALPAWAHGSPLERARAWTWTPKRRAFVAHAATPDAQPGEGDLRGLGTTFPHRLAAASDLARAFRTSPLADEVLLERALAAIDAAPPGGAPLLVAVSLSANDYIGHTFGPDSWEAWDELDRLDGQLARFFTALDARFGRRGWAAMLSADHGVTTLPEAAEVARPWCAPGQPPDPFARACGRVGRLFANALAGELEEAAVTALGPGPWVAGVADPYVYLTPAARALPAARRRALLDALTAALSKYPEVARVYDVQALPQTCPGPADASLDALVCRSVAPAAGGALYVLPAPGSFFDADVVVGKGTSHGTPYLYDRTVPLFVRAPGRVRAGRVVEEPVSVRAFARTLASLLGVAPPAAAAAARDLAAE